MGFLNALGKMIQGKPVFDNEPQPGQPAQPPGPQQQTEPQRGIDLMGTKKELPIVMVDPMRYDVSHNGQRMDIDIFIQNHSQERLFLDKIKILGAFRELDTYLRPGERREFRVYSGNRQTNAPDARLEIWYRNELNDYFSAIHTVEFHKEPDNTFGVARIKFVPPIKDI